MEGYIHTLRQWQYCIVGFGLHIADSGVGAGIDSYYEYCLKAYVLLGDQTYLQRFSKVSGVCIVTTKWLCV